MFKPMMDWTHYTPVITSDCFGSGFSTRWDAPEGLSTHRVLAGLIEEGRSVEITKDLVCEIFGEDGEYVPLRDVSKLRVTWLPHGTEYIIQQYDGQEYILRKADIDWSVA